MLSRRLLQKTQDSVSRGYRLQFLIDLLPLLSQYINLTGALLGFPRHNHYQIYGQRFGYIFG